MEYKEKVIALLNSQELSKEQKEMLETIFPELKESEDEKIRKRIIQALHGDVLEMSEIKEAVDWLENQGKHSNFLSKIQVGDKVTRNEDGVLVNLSQLKRVAKPAEEQGEQKPADKVEHKFKVGNEINTANEEPLTITKIDEKGYWSEDLFICGFDEECCWDLVEKKSAEWSEDDQSNFCELRSFIVETYRAEDASKLITWLKSLKDRVQPQPKQEWSEEDYNEIETIACHLDNTDNEGLAEALRNIRDKYYHIIPQSTWKPSDEQMDAFYTYLYHPQYIDNSDDYRIKLVISLYEQLKKLKV